MNLFKESLKNICSRGWAFYLLMILLCWPLINFNAMKVSDRAKLRYFEYPQAYKPLVDYIERGVVISPEILDDYKYFLEKKAQTEKEGYDYWHVLGFIHHLTGDDDKARDIAQRLAKASPSNLYFQYNLCVSYFNQGRFKEARDISKEMIAISPEMTADFFKGSKRLLIPILAEAKISSGQLKRNIKQLYRDAYLTLVISNFKEGDYSEMLRWSKAALAVHIGHEASFYFLAGLAQYHLKNLDEAVASFQKAIDQRVDLAEGYEYTAKSLVALGRIEESRPYEEKYQMFSAMSRGPALVDKRFDFRIY